MNAASPVERKVKAATAGAGVGTALAQLVLWLIGHYTGRPIPDDARVIVLTVVPAILAYGMGWLARHTPRADPAADPPVKPLSTQVGLGAVELVIGILLILILVFVLLKITGHW